MSSRAAQAEWTGAGSVNSERLVPYPLRAAALLIALSALAPVACSSPQRYQYTQMRYEANSDNEEDSEHILSAFQRCLSSDNSVLDQWRTEHPQQPAAANSDDASNASSFRPKP